MKSLALCRGVFVEAAGEKETRRPESGKRRDGGERERERSKSGKGEKQEKVEKKRKTATATP